MSKHKLSEFCHLDTQEVTFHTFSLENLKIKSEKFYKLYVQC